MGFKLLSELLPYLPFGKAQSRSASVSSTESLCGTTGDLYSRSVVLLCALAVQSDLLQRIMSPLEPHPQYICSLINCAKLQFDTPPPPPPKNFQHIIPFKNRRMNLKTGEYEND